MPLDVDVEVVLLDVEVVSVDAVVVVSLCDELVSVDVVDVVSVDVVVVVPLEVEVVSVDVVDVESDLRDFSSLHLTPDGQTSEYCRTPFASRQTYVA